MMVHLASLEPPPAANSGHRSLPLSSLSGLRARPVSRRGREWDAIAGRARLWAALTALAGRAGPMTVALGFNFCANYVTDLYALL
jgi:hypothetical protein